MTALTSMVAGSVGLIFTRGDIFFSPFWPLSGVAAGCILLGGPWMALGVYAGLVLHNAMWGLPALLTWLGPLGLALESLAAYWLASLFLGPRPRLTDLRGCLVFLVVIPWLPALLNGFLGAGLLFADETILGQQFGQELATFVLANGSGIALLAPAFAVWTQAPDSAWWRRMLVLGPLCLGTGWLVFFTSFGLPPYLLFLPLLAAAAVLGLRGAAPLVAAESLLIGFSVLQSSGPFADLGQGAGVYRSMYLFLAFIAVSTLGIAAMVDHYRRRLNFAARGTASAGLQVWAWEEAEGLCFDRIGNGGLLAKEPVSRIAPEMLFDADQDHGTRETEIEGRPVLSFWEVSQRLPSGRASAANGVVFDLSERLSLEQARRRAWQSEIELRNLRASLAPHLLFNCLAAMRGIVRADPERARAFIDHLARFLRDSTTAQSRETIPLLDEWQLCEDFLALQAMRFERDLPRLVEIEGAAYHARVPPMTLLNFVENAVKHGQVDQLHPLIVSARLNGGYLDVSVCNRGKLGREPANRPGGLGIARARLQAVYGSAALIDISGADGEVTASLHLPAEPPPGTTA
ncbi:MAG: histidine kinase [Verrucomicrobia bacterium]|nr:histidine kinase [Verrucomicrobiota bacterium]MDA1202853.1 histidine kinase [Verrucomicrobiota bacterium]